VDDAGTQEPAPGGYNGGGVGGGYVKTVTGNTFQLFGGGGGGGGYSGGGGGGGVIYDNLSNGASGGGGGGGGSNLVPPGGTAATDTTGAGSVTISFADTVAPTVGLDAIAARTTPSVAVSGTSPTGLGDADSVTIEVYDGPTASGVPAQTQLATVDATAGTYHADLTGLTAGQHTVRVTRSDAAGNIGTSAARTFVVDDAAPILSLTTPASGAHISDSTPEIAGVAGTAVGDASTVQVQVTNAAGVVAFS